jgi:hypothetical protein
MCHFKAFMLLRFYLLKYNDTIIVQSGVFVNTDRHKKSHRKGKFCGSFFGENNEVYLSKTSSFIVTVAFACGDTKAHCHNAHKTAYQRSCKKFKHKNTSCG